MDKYLLVGLEGTVTEIIGDTKIGRSKSSDLVLVDPLVSRHHATIYYSGNALMVRDEQSVNGTIVNGSKIYEPTVIKDGDNIQIGDDVFTLKAPPSESQTIRADQPNGEEVIDSEDASKQDHRMVIIIAAAGIMVLCVCLVVSMIIVNNLEII